MKKKIHFIQIMVANTADSEKRLTATVVSGLETYGIQVSLIKVEHVTSKTRYEEIEKQLKGA